LVGSPGTVAPVLDWSLADGAAPQS
jgi:hypothetical protein